MDEENGLLGGMMMDPRSMGLLNLGAGLLQASGPSRMPIGLGQAIGMALPQGIQGMQTAYAMRQQDEMNKLRREQMRLEMERMRREEQDRQRKTEGLEQFRQAMTPQERDVTLPPLTPNDDEGNVNPEIKGRMVRTDPSAAQSALLRAFPELYAQQAFKSTFKDEAPLIVGKSAFVKGPDGQYRLVAQDQGSDKDPTKIQEYEFAVKQGFKGSFLDFVNATKTPPANVTVGLQSPYAGMDSQGNPIVIQPTNRPGQPPQVLIGPDGKPIRPPQQDKPLTDAQSAANLYASRMERSDQILQSLDGKYDVKQVFARGQVGDGMIGALINNTLTTEAQQVDQAQRDFVNAVLRRESGAVISPSEFKNAAIQYFPQPGDSDAVKRQKAANRKTAIDGLRQAAGGRAPVNNGGSGVIRYDANGNRIP